MAFTRSRGPQPQKGTLAYSEKQSAGARGSLFLVIVLTLINIILTVFTDSGRIFLFSALAPMTFSWSAAEAYQYGDTVFMVIALGIVLVFMIGWVICALLWKKGLAASIIATLLYLADCLFVAAGMIGVENEVLRETLPIAVFHVLIMIYLIVGIVHEAKARKLRKEAEFTPAFVAEQEKENAQNGPEL